MKIVDLHFHQVAVGRVYRYMATDLEGSREPESIWRMASNYFLYELETESGLRGLGEISDVRAREKFLTPAELREVLANALIGVDPLRRRPTWEAVEAALPETINPEYRKLVTASVDMALWDIAGKHYGVPLYELFGGRYHDSLPVSWVSYLRSAELLEEEIQEKLQQGFCNFKLKAGEIELDCERVREFRRIAGPEVYLRLDASGAWEEEEAIENIRRLAELGVVAVETPIKNASRVRGINNPELVDESAAEALARVRAAVPVQIIEHVGDFPDAFSMALARHRAVDVFNLIPCQTGSFHRAQRLIHLAEQAGIQVMLGSTVELGIGTAASVHLGLASKAVSVASDLVGPGFLVGDVATPRFQYERGRLGLAGEGPGLGVALDRSQVERYRSD